MIDKFLDMEPEEIRLIIKDDDKFEFLQALITLIKSPIPWKDFYIFNNVIKALNYKKPDFHNFDPVDVEEMWNGLYIIHKFLPKAEFDGEVLLFIKTVLTEGGIHFLPPFIEESEAYKLIKDKAENGPFPLGDDFIDAQATKLMALDTKHKIESTKDYSWLTYNLT